MLENYGFGKTFIIQTMKCQLTFSSRQHAWACIGGTWVLVAKHFKPVE